MAAIRTCLRDCQLGIRDRASLGRATWPFGFGRDPSLISSPLISHRAPDFALRTLDGKLFSLASTHDKPVVLNFWASCPACKDEHPYLVQGWEEYRASGVVFAGIVYQDTSGDARAFIKEYGGGWPNLISGRSNRDRLWGSENSRNVLHSPSGNRAIQVSRTSQPAAFGCRDQATSDKP